MATLAAVGTGLDAILKSNLPQLNDWLPNLNAFLFGHKRFVLCLRIAALTLQTATETFNCRYKRTNILRGPTSDDIAELECT